MSTTTNLYTVTVGAHSISTIKSGVVAVGPTTEVFTAGVFTNPVGSDDVCCGDCHVLYPVVQVYYWPVNNTKNTWCLEYLTGSNTLSLDNVVVSSSGSSASSTNKHAVLTYLPKVPSFAGFQQQVSQKRSSGTAPSATTASTSSGGGPDPIPPGGFGVVPPQKRGMPITARAALPTHQPLHQRHQTLLPRKFIPLNDSFLHLLGGDASTFVSPSVYVVFTSVYARDSCGLVGKEFHSLTYAYAESQLSSIDPVLATTAPYNFADLPCPPSSWINDEIPNPLRGHTAMLADRINSYHPNILGPESSLKALDPAWSTCSIVPVGNGYDPPRILTPGQVMASNTDSLPIINFPKKAPVPKKAPLNLQLGPVEAAPSYKALPPSPAPLASPAPVASPVPLASPAPLDSPAPLASPAPLDSPAPLASPAALASPVPVAAPVNPAPTPISSTTDAPVVFQGQTITPNAAPINVQGTSVGVSGGSVYVGSSSAPVPQVKLEQPSSSQPVVAGGLTLTPAPTVNSNAAPPAPVTVGGLTFSAPQSQTPVKLAANPQPQPVVTNGVTYAPVNNQPSATPVTAGGMTLTPVQTSLNQNPGQTNQSPEKQVVNQPASPSVINGQTYTPVQQPPPTVIGGQSYTPVANQVQNPTVINGQTYAPVSTNGASNNGVINNGNPAPVNLDSMKAVTAAPAGSSIVENGVTYAPAPAGSPAPTPLGVVGGQTITGGASSAVVDGNTLHPGGAPITVAGTPLSLGSSALMIGTSSVPLPAAPGDTSLGTVGGQTISGDANHAVINGQTIIPGGAPVTVAGTPVSLGNKNLVIGTNSVALPAAQNSNGVSSPTSLGNVGGQVVSADASSAVIDGQTLKPGAPSVTIAGTPVSMGTSALVIGTNSIPLPAANAAQTPTSLGNVGGQVVSGDASSAVVDGQTITPGGPPVMISGTPVSLGSSAIVIGTNTVALPTTGPGGLSGLTQAGPSAFSIDGQTVTNGGAPITVSGTRISLGPSGLVVGSSTVPLTAPASLNTGAGAHPVFSIDGTAVTLGGPAITVSGTRVSLGSNGVVIGSQTISLPSSSALTVGDQTFTPNAKGFSIDGTTITPGGPAVMISGTAVSLLSNSELVVGSSTMALPAAPTNPILSVDGQTFTAIPGSNGGYAIDGTTVHPGDAPITVSGTAISLNPSGSLIIGSSTIALASGDANGPLTAGGETFTPLGSTAVSIDGTVLSLSGPALTDKGTVISLASGGLVVGSSTYAYATPASNIATATNGAIAGQPAASPSIFSIDGMTFTAYPSGLVVGGAEVFQGSGSITVEGTPISLGSSDLVIGSSTIPIASVSGLGPAISGGAAPSPTGSAGPSKTGSKPLKGAAGKLQGPMIEAMMCMVMMIVGFTGAGIV